MLIKIVAIIIYLYSILYNPSEDKFEKYLHILYHQKLLLFREWAIPTCYLRFDFVFRYECYHFFTYNYQRSFKLTKL